MICNASRTSLPSSPTSTSPPVRRPMRSRPSCPTQKPSLRCRPPPLPVVPPPVVPLLVVPPQLPLPRPLRRKRRKRWTSTCSIKKFVFLNSDSYFLQETHQKRREKMLMGYSSGFLRRLGGGNEEWW